jgi:hypothetical protein
MSDWVDSIVQETADAVQANPFFASLSMIVEKSLQAAGEMCYEDRIATALDEDGVAIAFPLPRNDVMFQAAPGPNVDIGLVCEIFYNPFHTQVVGRKTLMEHATEVLATLHHFRPASTGQAEYPDTNAIVISDDDGLKIARVALRVGTGLDIDIPQVAQPSITAQGGGNYTLACGTPGAAIFYTTNGLYPAPLNGTLYTGVFNAPSPVTIRVVAFLAGYVTSLERRQTF